MSSMNAISVPSKAFSRLEILEPFGQNLGVVRKRHEWRHIGSADQRRRLVSSMMSIQRSRVRSSRSGAAIYSRISRWYRSLRTDRSRGTAPAKYSRSAPVAVRLPQALQQWLAVPSVPQPAFQVRRRSRDDSERHTALPHEQANPNRDRSSARQPTEAPRQAEARDRASSANQTGVVPG